MEEATADNRIDRFDWENQRTRSRNIPQMAPDSALQLA